MVEQSKDPNATRDDRSPTAKAMSKVSEILACCLSMIIPAVVGIWLDQKFSTVLLFTLLGLLLGGAVAALQLMKILRKTEPISYDPSKIIKYEDDEEQEEDSNGDDWD